MIRSMTAFSRRDIQGEWGMMTCEIRAVNHRYLEPVFRLPDALRELENRFREHLRGSLKRGKVDVSLKIQWAEAANQQLEINQALVAAINEAANQLNKILDNPDHINALEILRWPGVLVSPEPDLGPVSEAAGEVFGQALDDLIAAREREGERLRPLFEQRLNAMSQSVTEVRSWMPDILQQQEQQLRDRFESAKIDLDADRLAQEMVMLAQKTDVAEELDRLDAHIREVTDTLQKGEAIGRRLDFLMQELNREANTLSSKSIDTRLTRAAVDMKVWIEQMREQVQNIE
ncbi:YicC/YloC family endoribonuclease [Marinobacter sp. X15-166B]|uniref:YicC/YloC family endoribonuclease n=1 Tax=Marinobacter sp. X15-166B TaxID=1897620 RepID=UPI00085BCE18|nr:YicC/YloC family endoribonuclease [Marinobacter sp. X15-166B]OEY66491.1 YicC family protein [Marinobacter sp. X15-166B]